jgi:microcompartment protein CcmL/EutN
VTDVNVVHAWGGVVAVVRACERGAKRAEVAAVVVGEHVIAVPHRVRSRRHHGGSKLEQEQLHVGGAGGCSQGTDPMC